GIGRRLLQRGDVDLPLTDGGVDRVGARRAALRRDRLRVGNDTGDLAAQVETGGLPVTEPVRHLRERVEPDLVPGRVVEDVAGSGERVLEVERPVAGRLVAPPAVVPHRVAAGAVDG